MFQDEFAVQIRLASGTEVSLFAHRSLVRKNGSDTTGYLRTNFVQDEQANATVLLPTESFETGNRWAMVPRADLHLNPA